MTAAATSFIPGDGRDRRRFQPAVTIYTKGSA
jgi:hypothetical protein